MKKISLFNEIKLNDQDYKDIIKESLKETFEEVELV